TVPIAIVWANSHGSFVLGPIVAAIFAAGEAAESARHAPGIVWRVRLHGAMRAATPYAAVACAMTVASLLNPLGIELLHFALTLSTSEVTKTFIDEWNATLSPRFMVRLPFAIFVGAVMLTLSVVVTCRRRFIVPAGLLLAAFA